MNKDSIQISLTLYLTFHTPNWITFFYYSILFTLLFYFSISFYNLSRIKVTQTCLAYIVCSRITSGHTYSYSC